MNRFTLKITNPELEQKYYEARWVQQYRILICSFIVSSTLNAYAIANIVKTGKHYLLRLIMIFIAECKNIVKYNSKNSYVKVWLYNLIWMYWGKLVHIVCHIIKTPVLQKINTRHSVWVCLGTQRLRRLRKLKYIEKNFQWWHLMNNFRQLNALSKLPNRFMLSKKKEFAILRIVINTKFPTRSTNIILQC